MANRSPSNWTNSWRKVRGDHVSAGSHPTLAGVRKFLLSLGFSNIPAKFGQSGAAWFHRGSEVLVMDTSPDNLIAAKQGIVPIDLQIVELVGDFTVFAETVENFLENAPKPETH